MLSSLDRFQWARVGLVSVERHRTRGASGVRATGYRGQTTRGTQGISDCYSLSLSYTHPDMSWKKNLIPSDLQRC